MLATAIANLCQVAAAGRRLIPNYFFRRECLFFSEEMMQRAGNFLQQSL
jgi:hypothetical protein